MNFNCSLCSNHYFGTKARCPRKLNCGHTFCHSCLEKRFYSSNYIFCPKDNNVKNFRVNFNYKNGLQSVPSNFSLESLTNEKQKPLEWVFKLFQTKYKEDGFCRNHGLPIKLICMDCQSLLCNHGCLTMNHAKCKRKFLK